MRRRFISTLPFFTLLCGQKKAKVLPGDDASCLNLYRPESPRILGVPDDFLDRGGFGFRGHAPLPDGVDDPWALLAIPLDEPGVVPAVADANSAQWILKVGLGDEFVDKMIR